MRASSISMNLSNSAEKTSGGGWPKFTKAKIPAGTDFAIEHGGDFARVVIGIASQSVPRSNRLRQPEIDLLEEPGVVFPL